MSGIKEQRKKYIAELIDSTGEIALRSWNTIADTLVDFYYKNYYIADRYRMIIFECGASMHLNNFDGDFDKLIKKFSDADSTLAHYNVLAMDTFTLDFINKNTKFIHDYVNTARFFIVEITEKLEKEGLIRKGNLSYK